MLDGKRKTDEIANWEKESGEEIDNLSLEEWFNKGVSLDKEGEYEEAIQCYDNALKINPRFAPIWFNKGTALGNLGKYEEALIYYDKALEIDPRLVEAWYSKGICLGREGKYEEAIKCYDKALE